MMVEWSVMKTFVDDRGLSIQWVDLSGKYWLTAIDGNFSMECFLNKAPVDTTDLDDFENNYKANGNQSPNSLVTTQFEKRDKTLKLVHGEASIGEDGTATVLIKVPGEAGTTDGRWISSGTAFFDAHTAGDKVLSVRFTDEDNLLGAGAGYVVGTYTDEEADEAQQGWVIPPIGSIKAEAIGGYGFAPAGFYIKIVGKKAGLTPSGTFYVNIEWGKKE